MNKISLDKQRNIVLVLFLAIPTLLLLLFTYYPAIRLIQLSFTNWNGTSAQFDWIGFQNYNNIFENPELFGVFKNHIPYVIVGIIQNIVAILLAVILNSKLKGRNFFRTILFLPFIMNAVAIAFMFKYVFDTTNGSLNMLLQYIGLESLQQSWLGNASLVNFSLASISFWRFVGYNMVIYLGALQAIPNEMYEAAKIDGANRFQTLWNLTLPNMFKIIQLNMFLTISGALAIFDLPFVLTKGGPVGASETFLLKTLQTAFQFNNFGLASAMSVVLILITIIVLAVQNLALNRRE